MLADMARQEDEATQATALPRGKLSTFGVLVLVLSLLLLYVATAGSSTSEAVVTATVLIFEPTEPASWQQLLHAGSVLQGRLRIGYPHHQTPLKWHVQSGRLVVTIPPDVSPEWLIQEASQRGSFELVEGGTQFLPLGRRVQSGPQPLPDQGVYEVVLSPAHVLTASARMEHSRPAVEFLLTPEGDAHLAAHTGRQRGYYLCILVDGEVVNCPLVRTPLIHRQGVIELTGAATLKQAHRLAVLMQTGPLPVTLRPVSIVVD
jgi:preprotein translocase subunit SecD